MGYIEEMSTQTDEKISEISWKIEKMSTQTDEKINKI
jgi:hypothetical protein